MSHLLLHEPDLEAKPDARRAKFSSIEEHASRGLFQHLQDAFSWYQRAVRDPATPEEEAEWQKTTF